MELPESEKYELYTIENLLCLNSLFLSVH